MFLFKKPLGRVLLVAFVILCAGGLGIAGFVIVRGRLGQGAHLRAEAAYAEQRWADAKTNYQWYLARHPKDSAALEKYIESSLNLLKNRSANVRDAGRARLQLAQESPGDRELAHQVVDFYWKHGLWRELEYAAGILLREHPGDERMSFCKALASQRLGRLTEARSTYERMIESGDPRSQVYGNLAVLLREQGLSEQAWQVLERALVKHPEEPGIRVERALFLLGGDDLAGAAGEIEQALDAGADTSSAFLTAAKVHMAQKDWGTAQTLAESAVSARSDSAQSDSAEAYSLVATCLLAENQAEEAIALLSSIDPFVMADNPELYLMLAEIQIDADHLTDVDETIEAYRTAYPNNREVFEYLAARKLLKTGLASEAVSKLELVVERAPELRIAQFFLVLAYLENGQQEHAKNTLELYLRNNPGDEQARVIWTTAFTNRSASDVANTARDLLRSDAPSFGSLMSTAFSLAGNRSDTDEGGAQVELAKDMLERAIEQVPSAPEGYRNLGFLYLDEEDVEGAQEVLARAELAGIASSDLSLLEAAIAIEQGELERASAIFDDELATEPMLPAKVMKWAALFADRGFLDNGLAVLDGALAGETTEESRVELNLGKVTVCTRAGDIEKACTLIEQLEESAGATPAMADRLNSARVDIARALLTQGGEDNVAVAERLTADVERTGPERTDAMVLRAQILLQQTPPDVDGAAELCAAALQAGAADAEVFLVSCEVAYRQGYYERALDHASKAYAKSSGDPRVSIALARAQLQMRQFAEAAMTLEAVDTPAADSGIVLELLASAYAGAGRFDEAEGVVTQLEGMEGAQETKSLRARMLIARSDWAAAEPLLREMHDENPEDFWTIRMLMAAKISLGRQDEAEAFIKACVSRQPEVPDVWVELGSFYLAAPDSARLSEASSAFSEALALQPNYYRALGGLLEVQIRSGNLGGALGLCDRLLAVQPGNPDLLGRKASLLMRQPGQQEEALAVVEQAIELDQQSIFYHMRGTLLLDRGNLRLKLGDSDNAKEDFARAIEDLQRFDQSGQEAPGNLDALMSDAYLGLDNRDLAQAYYDSAVKNSSRNTPADQARLRRIASSIAEDQNT